MKLRILNAKGHTEVDGTVEEIVGEVERFMNTAGARYSILAEKPGEAAVRVSSPEAVRTLDPETTVLLIPQLVGG